MSEVRFRIRGWQAVPVVVVVLAGLGWKVASARAALPEELTQRIELRLRAEYARQGLADLDGVDLNTLAPDAIDPRVQRILDASEVEIVSMSARGGRSVVVRVEVRVAGQPPPDGRGVRYYEAEHSTLLGWRLKRETTALSYWLKVF